MPDKQLRPCKHAGCPELTRDPSGYCETHRQDSKAYERYRGTAYSRGYDSQWIRFRLQYLRRHPLCIDCEARSIYTAASEVHHIAKLSDYPKLKYTEGNLMALCHECHARRTGRGE